MSSDDKGLECVKSAVPSSISALLWDLLHTLREIHHHHASSRGAARVRRLFPLSALAASGDCRGIRFPESRAQDTHTQPACQPAAEEQDRPQWFGRTELLFFVLCLCRYLHKHLQATVSN
ncbi:hypothetical protein SKAU_G00346770 [Synaphobranchus kaupii]|uniref:Uncharacterized protein n=1 Tax=Synaphobranchus kaupii TaxID=118154 RepID=A0A9Q1EJS0_SYNKA|nr:hypothetical protein SKAU_G00346770 [Synaphobranchus kaupii]